MDVPLESYSVNEGMNLTITCSYSGDAIVWEKNGIPVRRTDPDLHTTSSFSPTRVVTSTLTILQANHTLHTDSYSCIGVEFRGPNEFTYFAVTVNCEPLRRGGGGGGERGRREMGGREERGERAVRGEKG